MGLITGGDASELLNGGAGDDTILSGAGDDTVYGKGGNDLIDDYSASSFGGSDRLFGGAGSDTIFGYAGYDQLYGDEGDDELHGEDDSDTLNGGAGADTMEGGAESDTYYVDNAGDEVVEVSSYGWDVVFAGVSFTLGDFIEYLTLTGRNNISGTGNDLSNNITGNTGANAISGRGGNDELFGGNGADTLHGEAGNDNLNGGAGADSLVGGAGDDYYDADAADSIVEQESGGTDRVYTEFNRTLSANLENATVGSSGITVTGNSGANVFNGNGYECTLAGLGGNDWYEVYGSETIIEAAGNGIDTVVTSADNWKLVDNVENLTYQTWGGYYGTGTGNALANVLTGSNYTNTLLGLGGNDTLKGLDGNDTLDGGAGKDLLDGGNGVDMVLYTANTTAVRIDLVKGLASFIGQSWAAETLTAIENAQTGSGNDVFIGNAANNRFHGNAGSDSFDGAGGTDYFDGGAGSDTVLYTANTSSVRVDLAKQTATFVGKTWPAEAFAAIENASTGSAADTLLGSSAANVLKGGGGADRLEGAGGADRLIAGTGNDVFVFKAGASVPGNRDTIAGEGATGAFEKAGAALGDRIDLSGFDANTTAAGVQDFVFGSATGKGRLWVANSGNQTVVRGNSDNDAAAELELVIDDGGVTASQYATQDFIL